MNSTASQRGSYAGIVDCTAVVNPTPIIGGFAVACRCGFGEWQPTYTIAKTVQQLHLGASTSEDAF